jgi:hypothetical protein
MRPNARRKAHAEMQSEPRTPLSELLARAEHTPDAIAFVGYLLVTFVGS